MYAHDVRKHPLHGSISAAVNSGGQRCSSKPKDELHASCTQVEQGHISDGLSIGRAITVKPTV
jgi:hypothetical protein